jgi:hypothetical protein
VKGANAGGRPPFIGDMILVVPTDSFSGAREVQALKTIELRIIGEPSKQQRSLFMGHISSPQWESC